jgi:hypothetical protein
VIPAPSGPNGRGGEHAGAIVRTAPAGSPSTARASAARTHRLSGALGHIAQDRRGCDRDGRGSGKWSNTCARSSPAEPVKRSASRPPHRTRSRVGVQAQSCLPTFCSPSTACICPSTVKARSMPGKASISTSRLWPTGSARRRRR